MALNPADIATVSRLLDEALALPADQREAWLAALPADEQRHGDALRQMLEREAELDTDTLLKSLPRFGDDESVARCGEVIGPYRLLHEIGRGGMGNVWLAERADGSFKRQVALKLPRLAWGAGLAERMARERDIGALLEHTNIARLYDAGVDERGRPYLALEYIDGQPIDAWCEARNLSVRERLRLFVPVARAVAYAHGRLVVHRDLKPSNVLVTSDGQVHLLDFGIAKLLQEANPDEPGLTQQQGRVMTPHYASPEQVVGEAITVQSDVYSLGVLLYELLTGSLPIAPKRSTLGAVEEAILQGDAPSASSRVTDKITARSLRGEVDAIVAKAMQREPARRYATADAMAIDIERHLNGETVSARPDSLGYRLRKAVRRNWVAVAAGSAVLVAVLTGSGVAVVQAQRANAEADRARMVKTFVMDIFEAAGGSQGRMPAQELLNSAARRIDAHFARQPLLQADLYGVVGRMFHNMGNLEQAVAIGTRRIEVLTAAGAQGPAVAEALLSLADSLNDQLSFADSLLRSRRAVELASGHPALLVRAHSTLAYSLMNNGPLNNEEAAKELDIADQLMSGAEVPAQVRGDAKIIRGIWLADTGKLDASLPVFDAAIRIALEAEGPLSRTAMNARTSVAYRLIGAGRLGDARPYEDAALAAMRLVGGANDVRAALTEAHHALWAYQSGAGPFTDADKAHERALATLRSQSWAASPHLLAALDDHFGRRMLMWGDVQRGAPILLQATTALLAEDHGLPERWRRLSGRSSASMLSGLVNESIADAREMLAIDRQIEQGPDLEASYARLASTLMHAGRYREADAVLAEFAALPGVAEALAKRVGEPYELDMVRAALQLERGDAAAVLADSEKWAPIKDFVKVEPPWLIRASALCAAHRTDEGLALFADWLRRLASHSYDASPEVAHWRARMGLCALQAGNTHLARETQTLASAAIDKQPAVSTHLKAPVRELEKRLRAH
jgi:tetratricopeptide (TPR) repeat protein